MDLLLTDTCKRERRCLCSKKSQSTSLALFLSEIAGEVDHTASLSPLGINCKDVSTNRKDLHDKFIQMNIFLL